MRPLRTDEKSNIKRILNLLRLQAIEFQTTNKEGRFDIYKSLLSEDILLAMYGCKSDNITSVLDCSNLLLEQVWEKSFACHGMHFHPTIEDFLDCLQTTNVEILHIIDSAINSKSLEN